MAAAVLEGVANALKPMPSRLAHYVIRNSDLLAGAKFFDAVRRAAASERKSRLPFGAFCPGFMFVTCWRAPS